MASIESVQKSGIIGFLQALDKQVRRKTTLYIIGGAAVTLAYAPDNRTSDIDVVLAAEEVVELGGAGSDLAQEFGVYIQPLVELSFSAPDGWKDRCEAHDLSLKKLIVKTADRYDIILGKVARLEQRDIEDILAMNATDGIDMHILMTQLNDNLKEVRNSAGYRNNVKLIFEMLGRPIEFKAGKAQFS